MEQEAEAYFEKIDALGGVIPAIEQGFFQREIAEAAYRYQMRAGRGREDHRRRERLRRGGRAASRSRSSRSPPRWRRSSGSGLRSSARPGAQRRCDRTLAELKQPQHGWREPDAAAPGVHARVRDARRDVRRAGRGVRRPRGACGVLNGSRQASRPAGYGRQSIEFPVWNQHA